MKNNKILIPVIVIVLIVVALLINGIEKKQQPQEPPAQQAQNPQASNTPPSVPGMGAAASQAPVTVDSKGYVTTASGLKYKDIEVGTGAEAVSGNNVRIEYTGKLEDGKVFDATSRHNNEPFSFVLGSQGVIPGMDEGVTGMKVGGSREIIIPSELGYGEEGMPPVIPENATLIFKIKLVTID